MPPRPASSCPSSTPAGVRPGAPGSSTPTPRPFWRSGDRAGAREWFGYAVDADEGLETDAAERVDELDGIEQVDLLGDEPDDADDADDSRRNRSRVAETLADRYDGVVCDLDGVVRRGAQAVPYAVERLTALQVPVVYATNNASLTPQDVADQLPASGYRSARRTSSPARRPAPPTSPRCSRRARGSSRWADPVWPPLWPRRGSPRSTRRTTAWPRCSRATEPT